MQKKKSKIKANDLRRSKSSVACINAGKWIALLLFAFLIPAHAHAQSYELPCQSGSTPLPFGQTYNPVTNKYRAFECVDPFGTVSSPVFSTSGTNPTGQTVSTQLWANPGLIAPTINFSLTGGSFICGRAVSVRYTFNTSLGQTTASAATSGGNVVFSCSSGTTATLTITKPTFVLAGVTSYSVYAQDCGGTPCGGAEQLQASCTAITTNCVLTTVGAGASVPTQETAFLTPANVNSYVGTCPPGVIPSIFTPDVIGNYNAWFGMNMGDTIPTQTAGTPTFCFRTFFRDDVASNPGFPSQVQSFKNAFVSINHLAGKNTNVAGQDRALAVNMFNAAGDSGTYFGWEGIQSEVDVVGTPTFNGSPDGEVSAGSFQLSLSNTNTIGYGTLGPTAIRAQAFRSLNHGGVSSCTYCMFAIRAIASNQGNNSYGSSFIVAVSGETINSLAGTAISGIALLAKAPTLRLVGANVGTYIENHGTNTLDWNIFSQGLAGTPTAGRNWFGGNVYLPNVIAAASDINVTGSLVASGSLSTAQFAAPAFGNGAITATGVAGTTSYSYKITAVDGNGKESPASVVGTTALGNATLTGGNFNRITLSTGFVVGVGRFNVYRTASGGTPSSTGKIGTITITNSQSAGSSVIFDDTGLAGDSSTPPTQNQTGGIVSPLQFTSTACASSGGTCAAAPAGFVSIAAAATTVTVSTTAITALSQIFLQEDATLGAALGVTCNTTTGRTYTITTRTAGTSFVITASAAPVTNPACIAYHILN